MNVAKFSDELWKGVKGHSDLEIADIPRNIFQNDTYDYFFHKIYAGTALGIPYSVFTTQVKLGGVATLPLEINLGMT